MHSVCYFWHAFHSIAHAPHPIIAYGFLSPIIMCLSCVYSPGHCVISGMNPYTYEMLSPSDITRAQWLKSHLMHSPVLCMRSKKYCTAQSQGDRLFSRDVSREGIDLYTVTWFFFKDTSCVIKGNACWSLLISKSKKTQLCKCLSFVLLISKWYNMDRVIPSCWIIYWIFLERISTFYCTGVKKSISWNWGNHLPLKCNCNEMTQRNSMPCHLQLEN